MKKLFTLFFVSLATLCCTQAFAQGDTETGGDQTTTTNKMTFTADGKTETDKPFETGKLAQAIAALGADTAKVTSLTISGTLGNTDIYSLRWMAGASYRDDLHYETNNGDDAPDADIHNYIIKNEYHGTRFNYTSDGQLTTLDLANATFRQTAAQGDPVLYLPVWKTGKGKDDDDAVEWYAWRFYTGSNVPQFIFTGCSKLQTVTLPKDATEIGQHAFSYCSSLKTVNNIENILKFGGFSFYNDKVLGPITLNDNATEIDYAAFRECNVMTFKNSVTGDTRLPKALVHLKDVAFAACNALTTITVGPNVEGYATLIEQESDEDKANTSYSGPTLLTAVFQNCKGLKTVTLPSTTTTIGYCCFQGCNVLENIRFYDPTTEGFDYDQTLTLLPQANADGTVPQGNNNVVNIIADAFDQCWALNPASIGQFTKAELIGVAAFSGCHQLSDGNFEMLMKSFKDGTDGGNQVTPTTNQTTDGTPQRNSKYNDYSINAYTFADCYSLTKAVIPDKVVYIGQEAFRCDEAHTSLTEVTLSANLKSSERGLGDLAFANNKKLTKVTVRGAVAAQGPAVLTEQRKHTPKDENDTQMWDYTFHNPFNNIEPNQVEVVFDHSAGSASDASHANYETYLKEPCFTFLLTKTADEMNENYNIVKQQHGILKLKRKLKEGWNTLALPFQACFRNGTAYSDNPTIDQNDSVNYNFTPIARGLNQKTDPTTNVSNDDLAKQTGFMMAVYRGHNHDNGVFDFMVYTSYKDYPLNFGEPFLVRMPKGNLNPNDIYTFYDVDLGMKYTPEANTDNSFGTPESRVAAEVAVSDFVTTGTTTGNYNHDANGHFMELTYDEYQFTPVFTKHVGMIQGSTTPTMSEGIDIAEGDLFFQAKNGTTKCYPYQVNKNYGIRGFSGFFHKISKEGDAKEMTVMIYGSDGETTKVLNLSADGTLTESQPANVYSLSGQLVRANATSLEGLEKGIYLYKGKKYLVK